MKAELQKAAQEYIDGKDKSKFFSLLEEIADSGRPPYYRMLKGAEDTLEEEKEICKIKIFYQLQEILVNELGIDENEIIDETNVYDLDLESMDFTELAIAVEKEFEIRVPNNLISHVERNIARKPIVDKQVQSINVRQVIEWIYAQRYGSFRHWRRVSGD